MAIVRQAALAIVFLLGIDSTAMAADADGVCQFPLMKAFGRDVPKLTVRKTTDGSSKDEAKPASIGYENPNTGGEYLLLDAALRWDALECGWGSFHTLLVPTLEAHRSKFEANPVKKTSAKVLVEMWAGKLKPYDGKGAGHSFLPYYKIEFSQTRDSIKQKNSSSYVANMTLVSNRPWRPGGWVAWNCGDSETDDGTPMPCPNQFRWMPGLGVEYYDSLPVERTGLPTIVDINTTVAVGRMAIEYWPILSWNNKLAESRLQFLAEYVHRSRVSGDPLPEGDANLVTFGLTYYFDGAKAVGIGIEHEDGENPTRNFVDEERTTVSLKVKF